MNKLLIIVSLFIFSIMTSYSQIKPKINDSTCICQIGNAKTIQELIKQLNAWDKEALNAYENPNDTIRNYIIDGETPGYVDAHKKCLMKLGVILIWNVSKMEYEIKGNTPSELTEWSLKGQIKKITVIKYDQFEQTKNEPINVENWQNNATVNYNNLGNIDSLKILFKNKLTSKSEETNISYNYTNEGRSGTVLKNKKDTISIIRKKWLTNQHYVEEYFDSKNNLFKTTWTFLDSNNRITHQRTEEKYTKSTIKIEPFDVYYTFNENSYLEKITTKVQGKENVTFVDKNADLEFDNYGNPTKSIKVENNKSHLVIRKYEYF